MYASRYIEIGLCLLIMAVVIINPNLVLSIPNRVAHAIVDLAEDPDEKHKASNGQNIDELTEYLIADFESYIIKFPNSLSYDTTILLGDGKITNLGDNGITAEEVSRNMAKMEMFMEEKYKVRKETVFKDNIFKEGVNKEGVNKEGVNKEEVSKENIIENIANQYQYLYLHIADGEYQLSTAKELVSKGETLK